VDGRYNMVDLLIKNGANVNDKSEQGFTALMGGIY
jgi:ankyrin repeat protein